MHCRRIDLCDLSVRGPKLLAYCSSRALSNLEHAGTSDSRWRGTRSTDSEEFARHAGRIVPEARRIAEYKEDLERLPQS